MCRCCHSDTAVFYLRAGKQPELGDVNRRDRLPLYRAVGRLEPPSPRGVSGGSAS